MSDAGGPFAGSGIGGESGTQGTVDDVRFDWVQTLPMTGACAGRAFVGRINCMPENVPGAFEGALALDMVGPDEAQQLDVKSGAMNVLLDPNGSAPLQTEVTGGVDCPSRDFKGEIPATMLTSEQTGIFFSVITLLLCSADNTVKGTLTGKLDASGTLLDGEASMMIGSCSCRGPFNLRAQL